MLLTSEQLGDLVKECDKLIADPSYRSPELYVAVDAFIYKLISIKRYYYNTAEVCEQLQLDALMKIYTKMPRYKDEHANRVREKYGYEPNRANSIYRFAQVIILTSFLTTFKKINNIKNKKKITVALDDDNNCMDLADIKQECIDSKLDAEARDNRATAFEHRLDLIEKGLK